MHFYKIWTLEQSILGSGKKTVTDASRQQLLDWAKLDPPEDVPHLVWRTELAMIWMNSDTWAKNSPLVQDLVHALGYYPTVFANIDTMDVGVAICKSHKKQQQKGRLRCYRISYADAGLVWSWDPANRYTKGFLYGIDPEGLYGRHTTLNQVQFTLQSYHHLRTNPFLLGLLMLEAEVYFVEKQLRLSAGHLSNAQMRTGRHRNANIKRNPITPDVDLVELSADVCGSGTNVSFWNEFSQGIQRSLDFIVDEFQPLQEQNFDFVPNKAFLRNLLSSKDSFISIIKAIERHNNRNLGHAWQLQRESDIIMQTVFTMTNQRDQELSIQLARDSVRLAHDSKTLAEETKLLAEKATRDSNSMKAIAAVTMFFLPGTFVASLFATPMFSFHIRNGQEVSRSFWLYWAVTLPLTISVVVIWLVWTNREELKGYVAKPKRQKRRDSESVAATLGSRPSASSFISFDQGSAVTATSSHEQHASTHRI